MYVLLIFCFYFTILFLCCVIISAAMENQIKRQLSPKFFVRDKELNVEYKTNAKHYVYFGMTLDIFYDFY